MRGRKPIQRHIDADHSHICFKPCGVKHNELAKVADALLHTKAIRIG